MFSRKITKLRCCVTLLNKISNYTSFMSSITDYFKSDALKNTLLFYCFLYATSLALFLTCEVNRKTMKPTHNIAIVVPIVNLTSAVLAFFPFTITVNNYVIHTVIRVAPESMIPTAKLPFRG